MTVSNVLSLFLFLASLHSMYAPSESTEDPVDDGGGSQSYSRDSEFFTDVKPLCLRVSLTFRNV